MKVSKNAYLQGFGVFVLVLALFRCACPGIVTSTHDSESADSLSLQNDSSVVDTITTSDIVGTPRQSPSSVSSLVPPASSGVPSPRTSYLASSLPHPIYSIPGRFSDCFPDSQQVHLVYAQQWGVKAVQSRTDAEKRKSELVYVGANPYFEIDNLRSSIPYLVPRASTLLNDIGRAYFDSLYVKGIPLHKLIVTSVLRTKEDVANLKLRNGNATENSCHLYGTTFDISQNRYKTVSDPRKSPRRQVQNDTLKWVLSEVLRDFRNSGRCLIKYEVHQGCFHVTVR